MIRNLFGGATKCRTIDKLDIFGDGSGVALYRLDGNANDESGNYHGTETDVTYGGGVYERGAVFNGSSSNVTASNFKLPIGAKTLSFLVKSTVSSNYNQIINDSNTGISGNAGITGTSVAFDLNTGKIYFKAKETPVSSDIFTLISATSVTDGNWHHIVCLWDGTITTNSVKIYIDGVLSISGTASGLQTSTPEGYFTVGKPYGTGNYFFNGSLDQVRIFNRAITAQEVATLYAECEPTSIVDNINPFEDGSLKALYKFDNDATDATGVYNGTATNVTYASGKFGNCAVFSQASLGYINTTCGIGYPITISAWVKRATSGLMHIVSKYNSDTIDGLTVQIVSDGTIYLMSGGGVSAQIAVAGSYIISSDIWHHVVATVSSGTNGCSLYVNGTLIGSGTITHSLSSYLYIGRRGNLSSYTSGSIDQLRIFNKALTPLEVASLYNETTPMEEPMSVQVDPFKDGSGKALYRLEGNALDESGNYNLTALTNVVYESGRFGRGVRATSDTGTNLPTSYSTTNFTVSLWIKENVQASKYLFNFKTGNQTVYNQFYFANNVNTNRVSVMVYNYLSNIQNTVTFGTNVYTTHGINFAGTPVAGKLSEWYMVTATYDGATLKAYENGVLIGSANIGSGWSLTAGVYSRLSQGTGESIDQIRVFNKALTQTEVTALYNEI